MNKKSSLVPSSKKKLDFNYDLSALPEYNSYGSEMLIKSFLGLTLPRYSTIRPNLKGTTEKVGFVTNDVILQDLSCGFDPTGTTTQNLVTIDLCNKKVNMELCAYDLYNTYLSQYLSNDNFQEAVPFEEVILQDITNRVNDEIEKQLWRNTTATGATPYNSQCFNGVISLITTGNGASSISYTAATPSNGLDVFTQVYQAIPENVLHRNDLVIYASYADYRALVASMRNSSYINLFSFDDASAAAGEVWSVMLPGTNVRVIPTQGLTGQNKYYGGPSEYIMVGTNMDLMTTKALYDPFQDVIKINMHTTYGVGVFDPGAFVVAL
jgi:hypothetical protein